MRTFAGLVLPVVVIAFASGCSGDDDGSGSDVVDVGADAPTSGDDGFAPPDDFAPPDGLDGFSDVALAGTWVTDCLAVDPPPGAVAYVYTARFDGDVFEFSQEYFAEEGCGERAASQAGELATTYSLGGTVVTADGFEAVELDTSYPAPSDDGDVLLERVEVPNLVATEGGVLYFGTSAFTRPPVGGRPERLDFDRPYRLR